MEHLIYHADYVRTSGDIYKKIWKYVNYDFQEYLCKKKSGYVKYSIFSLRN